MPRSSRRTPKAKRKQKTLREEIERLTDAIRWLTQAVHDKNADVVRLKLVTTAQERELQYLRDWVTRFAQKIASVEMLG